MEFPRTRLSRLRATETFRNLVSETALHVNHLVQPLFVHHGENIQQEIPSMPGQFQYSQEHLVEQVQHLSDLGIRTILLFGIPEKKDDIGSDSWDDENGIIQNAVRAIKNKIPGMTVITDVCFCEYTTHGHCGIIKQSQGQWILDHDATLNNLALQAVSHARAGADMVAPSGMIDGAVAAIREALDAAEFTHTPIMAYAAKYASGFYGPFRDAVQGAPQFGDRRSYQMNPANGDEALREVQMDIDEGADIVMVKPALAYLDVIQAVKKKFSVPTAAYNVSGEYAMVKAAALQGWLDEKNIVMEIATALRRAGADIIISYHSTDIAGWLR